LSFLLTPNCFSSLFSTAHAAVIRDAPFAALYYSAYEMMKDVQRWLFGIPREEKLSRANNFIGGGIAGAFASICTNPMDVVKTYVILTVPSYAFHSVIIGI
jgi:hypothetical protein